jgi:ABC-2 type transport system ATP-binding protein
MLVELDNVTKQFGAVRALDSVTAAVDGQIIGLLGPNGAGKSTLLKCMLGLTPHRGSARVLGMSPATEAFAIRERVGYMPEIDAYLAGMTAVELCAYAGQLSGLPPGEAMQRAHASLFYAGLGDKRYLEVEGYSTGMKQRVKLAQALVHDPELLFLDEPTNGLDPRARDEMLELITELPARRGCAVVISTHLLPDVDQICDHVFILVGGRHRFFGSVEALRGARASERIFDVEIKSDSDSLGAELEADGCEVAEVAPRRMIVTLPEGGDSAVIFRAARRSGAQVRHLEVRRDSLEEAFLRVIQDG